MSMEGGWRDNGVVALTKGLYANVNCNLRCYRTKSVCAKLVAKEGLKKNGRCCPSDFA